MDSSTQTQTTAEPEAKKPKLEEELKDWEAVDKPSETASEEGEGEKLEAEDLAAEEGEKVEKPMEKEKEGVDELADSGEVLPKSGLLRDW